MKYVFFIKDSGKNLQQMIIFCFGKNKIILKVIQKGLLFHNQLKDKKIGYYCLLSCIFEKAYAKLKGSYADINEGKVSDAFKF